MFLNSDMEVEGFEAQDLGLYVALNNLIQHELEDRLHTTPRGGIRDIASCHHRLYSK